MTRRLLTLFVLMLAFAAIGASAPAVAANATKSTTEQGRIASVARRRIRPSVAGASTELGAEPPSAEEPRVVRDHAVRAGGDNPLELGRIVDGPGQDRDAHGVHARDRGARGE